MTNSCKWWWLSSIHSHSLRNPHGLTTVSKFSMIYRWKMENLRPRCFYFGKTKKCRKMFGNIAFFAVPLASRAEGSGLLPPSYFPRCTFFAHNCVKKTYAINFPMLFVRMPFPRLNRNTKSKLFKVLLNLKMLTCYK